MTVNKSVSALLASSPVIATKDSNSTKTRRPAQVSDTKSFYIIISLSYVGSHCFIPDLKCNSGILINIVFRSRKGEVFDQHVWLCIHNCMCICNINEAVAIKKKIK